MIVEVEKYSFEPLKSIKMSYDYLKTNFAAKHIAQNKAISKIGLISNYLSYIQS